jgi:hypothetical protein
MSIITFLLTDNSIEMMSGPFRELQQNGFISMCLNAEVIDVLTSLETDRGS